MFPSRDWRLYVSQINEGQVSTDEKIDLIAFRLNP